MRLVAATESKKLFDAGPSLFGRPGQLRKSFLLLFFKKEVLAFF
jgi:hypothetical protein